MGTNITDNIVAIFYPFSQFCEINISLLSLQTQPNTAQHLFQRGVECGKYGQRNTLPTDRSTWHRLRSNGNGNTGRCDKHTPFTRARALQSSSRNCFPVSDLMLCKPILPRVLLLGGLFYSHTHTPAVIVTVMGSKAGFRSQKADILGEAPRSFLKSGGSGSCFLMLLHDLGN